jgi:hypothetical protein
MTIDPVAAEKKPPHHCFRIPDRTSCFLLENSTQAKILEVSRNNLYKDSSSSSLLLFSLLWLPRLASKS